MEFEPYTIFGASGRVATTNLLAVLAHATHGEIDVASLGRILNEHDAGKMRKALVRLQRRGLVTERTWNGMRLFRLDNRWPAHKELQNLLLAMGRVWPEYQQMSMSEVRTYPARRRAREGR